MTNLAIRAADWAARPQLLLPSAAEGLARRILAVDPRALQRPRGPMALFRRLAGRAGAAPPVMAFDQDDDHFETPTAPTAYCPTWLGEPDGEGEWGWSLKDGVALLNIDSALSPNGSYFCGAWWHGYDTLAAAWDEMLADDRVKAIFVRADSPGGVVSGGLDALAAKILANRGAAGGKPVHVYADMAASAMYWLAAQADRIIAPRVGLVGSIGCVLTHVDVSKWLAEEGVTVTPIQFGARKTDGADFKPLDPEARAAFQAQVDQIGRDFVAAVVAGRPQLTADDVLATQAAAYMAHNDDPAQSGLALKLADAIADEMTAFAALRDSVATSSGARAPANPAAPAATQPAAARETDMKRSNVAAILANAALTDAEKLARIGALARAEGEDTPMGEGEDTMMGEGEDTLAGDGEDTLAGGDGGDEPTDPMATAQAVLDLPEAQGREALARKLAFTPGMTVAQAKGLLAAAPKASALSQRMAGRDPNLRPAGAGQADLGAALVADAKAKAEAARPGRR